MWKKVCVCGQVLTTNQQLKHECITLLHTLPVTIIAKFTGAPPDWLPPRVHGPPPPLPLLLGTAIIISHNGSISSSNNNHGHTNNFQWVHSVHQQQQRPCCCFSCWWTKLNWSVTHSRPFHSTVNKLLKTFSSYSLYPKKNVYTFFHRVFLCQIRQPELGGWQRAPPPVVTHEVSPWAMVFKCNELHGTKGP